MKNDTSRSPLRAIAAVAAVAIVLFLVWRFASKSETSADPAASATASNAPTAASAPPTPPPPAASSTTHAQPSASASHAHAHAHDAGDGKADNKPSDEEVVAMLDKVIARVRNDIATEQAAGNAARVKQLEVRLTRLLAERAHRLGLDAGAP